ncbi:MAG: hypothetical protein P8179_16720 [Candidatus Thiodiazotropha sp.]
MCRLIKQTESIAKIFRGAAFLLVVMVLMVGCGDSSETSETDTPATNNEALIGDSSAILANLMFSTVEDDAHYQCLLSEATASASSRGLSALPVVYLDQSIEREVYATWCKTIGCGAKVDSDLSSCQHYLTDTLYAPDTEALQIFATIESHGDLVSAYGLRSVVIPSPEITGFKVDYEWGKRDYQIYYKLVFTPFDGIELECKNKVGIGSSYGYVDTENDINETYRPGNTIAEQLQQLSVSSRQFKSTVIESLEVLREQVNQSIANSSSMDDAIKESAMANADIEIDRRIEVINSHGEEMYTLAVKQFSIANGCQ